MNLFISKIRGARVQVNLYTFYIDFRYAGVTMVSLKRELDNAHYSFSRYRCVLLEPLPALLASYLGLFVGGTKAPHGYEVTCR